MCDLAPSLNHYPTLPALQPQLPLPAALLCLPHSGCPTIIIVGVDTAHTLCLLCSWPLYTPFLTRLQEVRSARRRLPRPATRPLPFACRVSRLLPLRTVYTHCICISSDLDNCAPHLRAARLPPTCTFTEMNRY